MSLLFKTLSRFVITFLLRSNHLLTSWLQSTICSDSGAHEEEICHYFHLFPLYLPCSSGARCHDLSFFNISFKPALSLSSFTLNKSRVVSSAHLRLLIFLPPILISSCNLSSPAFLTMCSAYRLNKQGDSRQPCCTPFLTLNQSVVPYRVLTAASCPANRFLRRQVRGSGIPISLRAFQFVMIHKVKCDS